MRVLITGISGALGRMVAEVLLERGHSVVGIDRRPWADSPEGVEVHRADIRKRPAEDVFRSYRPDAVVHMATVTHFTASAEERYRINLYGTQAVVEHAHTYGVKAALFVGRHTVYGAAADAPLYHCESEPPLAGSTFPELADLVAADLFAASALWKWPSLRTVVLRLVYTLGPSGRGTLANYLSKDKVPTVLGFDPLYHFMHERDAAVAIACALESEIRGVFNVAGPNPVPLSMLVAKTGRMPVPLPEFVFDRVVGRFGLSPLPRGAINHVKYPIVVDSSLFASETGFEPQYDELRTMESFRWRA